MRVADTLHAAAPPRRTGVHPLMRERPPMPIATTERLTLREFAAGDAPFVLELLNDPSWLRFFGDKDVRTEDDALRYIAEGPVTMYARLGFGRRRRQRSRRIAGTLMRTA